MVKQADMVSAAIEEMSASIRDVAQSSMGAADGAVQTEEVATRGQSVVGKTISSMQKIDNVVVDVTSSVKELGNRGEEIGSIVTVIPITVIKCSTQSHVRTQSASKIDEGIVVLRQVNFMQ